MLRTIAAIVVLLSIQLCIITTTHSQCILAPAPDPCTGTEPGAVNNETITNGVKKWYYGAPVTFSSLTVKGGTLVVCSDLTINNFAMDSGIVIIRPGAHLKLTNGAGIVLRGKSAIYNYGLFDCTSNLSLDNTWASPSKPNIVMNVTADAVLNMNNQYFTISTPNGFFVNRGTATFWGLITDYQAGPGSVCLGYNSQTRMTVLYNNSRYTYMAPEGRACVHVNQYSQFRDTLTNSANINICLAASHVSDATCIASGCKPNAWGTTNIFQFCGGCSTISLLNTPTPRVTTPRTPTREKGLFISPNPFSNSVRVTWGRGEKPRCIYFIAVSGVTLFRQSPGPADNEFMDIQVPGIVPPGDYFIKLVYSREVQVRRILKTHSSP